MKKKIISVIVGVAGLTMAYFLASGISHIIYNRPTDNAAAETESTTDSAVQGTEEAKSAMTEDEINEMLARHEDNGNGRDRDCDRRAERSHPCEV